MLTGAEDLHTVLDEADTVVVDCRGFAEYASGHIPGAVNLDVFAFHWFDTSGGGMGEFARQSGQLLSFAGVGGGRVIFYDNISGMLAARGLAVSRHLCHPDATVLDGGLGRWRALGYPVETEARPYVPSPVGDETCGLFVGHSHILDGKNLVLVDARSPAEYSGKVARAARAGHIPGAINIDWNLNLAADGSFKGRRELERLYGCIPRDRPVVTYCQGAYRAANSFVAMKLAGFEDVKIYLGSWGEWGNRPGLPVE